MFPECIETDRLELTALGPENVDVLTYYDICSGNTSEEFEAVTEYLPWDPHDTPKETKEFLERLADQREAGENAEFAVLPKEDEDGAGEIAGAVGLSPDWERRSAELGIWLRKPFWGRGYYSETFSELAAVTFDLLDLELVEIIHRHGNEKSRRATETFVEAHGGQHEGRLRNYWAAAEDPADAHRYTITREQWERSRSNENADL